MLETSVRRQARGLLRVGDLLVVRQASAKGDTCPCPAGLQRTPPGFSQLDAVWKSPKAVGTAFTTSTPEAEVDGESLSSRPAWSTERVPR